MPKLLCYFDDGHEWRFRETLFYWAGFSSELLHMAYEPDFEETLRRYNGREYTMLSLNRNRKRSLTLEFRVAESHPIKSYAFVNILNALVKMSVRKRKPLIKITSRVDAREFYSTFDSYYRLFDRVSLPKIGIDLTWTTKEEFTMKSLAYEIRDRVRRQVSILANRVFEYVYSGNRLSRNSDYMKFLESQKSKKTTLLPFLRFL